MPHPYFEARTERVKVTAPELGTLAANVVVHGSGPPLLLVHGLMTTSYSWRYLIEPLGRRYRLVIPDLPGCGRASPAAGHVRRGRHRRLVGDLQRALGIEGCLAIGNSMGGYLCMRRALRARARSRRLVNIHSPAFPDAKLDLLRGAPPAAGRARARRLRSPSAIRSAGRTGTSTTSTRR